MEKTFITSDFSYPTICIPKINSNIKKRDIQNVFKKFDFGLINNIDIICINGFYKAFIHLKWNLRETSKKARKLLLENNNFKIIYNEQTGFYWKCQASISKKNLPKINQP